jgi:enoyl-CoA hydratase
MSDLPVIVETADGVMTITLNRPKAKNATFGMPETKRGLVAGAGGLVKLPKQIPSRVAKELALTGDFFTASRAYDLGLVNQVVSAGEALDAARALAEKIAGNGPLAVAITKEVIDKAQDWTTDVMFAHQSELIEPVFSSEDAIEGATAFAEKRAPVWKGR